MNDGVLSHPDLLLQIKISIKQDRRSLKSKYYDQPFQEKGGIQGRKKYYVSKKLWISSQNGIIDSFSYISDFKTNIFFIRFYHT